MVKLQHFEHSFHSTDGKTGLPVRSAVLKPHAGQLVLRWVTTWESWLLIVFVFFDEYFLPGFSNEVDYITSSVLGM